MSLKNIVHGAIAILCALYSQTSYAATYEYDALGRLTKTIYKDGNTVEYSYDAAGNRTQYVVTATSSSNSPPVANNDSAVGYSYQTSNIYVLNNDTDPDGDSLTVTSVTSYGAPSCSVMASTYIACFIPPYVYGTQIVDYSISDGKGGTDTGTININIIQ